MKQPALLVLALAAPYVFAQTTPSGSATVSRTSSATPVVTTSFSVSQSFSGRVGISVTVPIRVTVTPSADAPTAPSDTTTKEQPSIDTRTWPTAAETADGGPGGGSNGAPSPGQMQNGQYGPNDDYIAGALRSAAIGTGAVIGALAVGAVALL